MADYKIISADTHIVEPPDLWEDRIDHRFRHRAPELKITKNEDGILHHAWFMSRATSALRLAPPSRTACDSTTPPRSTG